MEKTFLNRFLKTTPLLCALMVVGIHSFSADAKAPKSFNTIIQSIFSHGIFTAAVPIFFMISGYYAYKCNNKDLWRRLLRNLIYLVGATAVYLLWGIWKIYHLSDSTICSYLHDNFNRSTIRDFLFYGVNTFSTPLWFIEALVVADLHKSSTKI